LWTAFLVSACSSDEPTTYHTLTNPSGLGVVRRPEPYTEDQSALSALPSYDPSSTDSFQVDLRGRNLSSLQLVERSNDLAHSVFDNRTVWPSALPADFSPAEVLEVGKNPGLGVRSLHQRGITGKGIGLAIIDQSLLVDHSEYAERLRCYEELHWPSNILVASMHGAAVASVAVGKTIGVAPDAELYFVAEQHGTYAKSEFLWDFTWLAQAIDRVIEIDAQLPAGSKIRVISISVGWAPDQRGYDEVTAAVARAVQAGIFVVSSSLELTYGYRFQGLGRAPLADPELAGSYGPGSWWEARFYAQPEKLPGDVLMAPMDSRTAASHTGNGDYFWGRVGGLSWTIPYVAGLYALACQVQPTLTPDAFWSTALATAATTTLRNGDSTYSFGKIVDPVALIDALLRQQAGAP
jgi:hypothetical protein